MDGYHWGFQLSGRETQKTNNDFGSGETENYYILAGLTYKFHIK